MLELGTVVGGKYCIEEQIAEGGMATIWRAVHMDLDRPVAVKFLNVRSGRSKTAHERFLREARVAASVRHRYVVDTIDFGITDHGEAYIVMELLEGESLGARLYEGKPLHVSSLLAIITSTLKGLAAAHTAGIVHRDLKPENIVLVRDTDGSIYPKLIDFGISRAISESSVLLGPAKVTREGIVVGTPHYMSPEQARGLADLDLRTDIYSIGVIIYEALTGELPFNDENPGDLLVKIMSSVAKPVSKFRPDLGQPLSDVVERAMARDRDARYQTADAMREALVAAAEKTAETATEWGTALAGLSNHKGSLGLATPSIHSAPPSAVTVSDAPVAVRVGRSTPRDPGEAHGVELPASRPASRAKWIALAAVAILIAGVAAALFTSREESASSMRPAEIEPARAVVEPAGEPPPIQASPETAPELAPNERVAEPQAEASEGEPAGESVRREQPGRARTRRGAQTQDEPGVAGAMRTTRRQTGETATSAFRDPGF